MERESFNSRIGFILVSAGCAIGIGNIWKFPYVAGENGGGIFVLFYLLFLAILGLPVLTMELAVGRASKKTAVGGYKALEPKGSKWHIHGWFALVGSYLLMMYYTTVAGWMISYFVKFLTGSFSDFSQEAVSKVYSDLLADPVQMTAFMSITVIVGFFVCSFNLQSGLERITKVMMTGLLSLILLLVFNSMTLSKATEGIRFYLLPDPVRALDTGLGRVITSAMNQAFFTLSVGIGSMEVFGSYMSKDKTLASESAWIVALDTFVALASGMVIFPACFSYNVQPDTGPSLIFITLPCVFLNMAGGRIWGALFFLFMTFASFSTVIAVFENLISSCMDNFGWSRRLSCIENGLFILAASLPCVLGYNVLSALKPIGGRNILNSEDFIVSNLLVPAGSLIFVLFCSTKWGWDFDNYLAEANTGTGKTIPRSLKWYFQFVLPLLILIILIQGLIE